MKKRIVLFAVLVCCSCIMLAVFSFLWFFGFPPFYRTNVTLGEIDLAPGLWVGKRVIVHGQITYGISFIPELIPPFNCLFEDPESHAALGVYWSKRAETSYLDGKNVTVVGVVKIAQAGGFHSGGYYLDAENITLSEHR